MHAKETVNTGKRSYKNLAAVVVFACGLFFYCLSLVSNFSAAHDSINYLNGITRGEELLHPHHLLYHPTARMWLIASSWLLPSVPDYFLIESYSALWGSGILSISYLFFRNRFFHSAFFSAAATAAIALCYGTWFYSSNIEVYAPPVFFVLICLYTITKANLNWRDLFLLGCLHALAVLFHQVNLLLLLPLVIVLWQRKRDLSFGRKLFAYLLPFAVLTVTAYTIAGVVIAKNSSPPSFLRWMLGYTIGHDYWSPLSLSTPLKALTGLAHAYIGGHFLFELPQLEQVINNSLSAHGLADEKFLVSTMSATEALVLGILTLLFVVLMLMLCWKFVRSFKSIRSSQSKVVDPLLICLAVYSIFFLFWVPENLEFWILQSILILLILFGTVNNAAGSMRSSVLPLSLALLLGAINLFGSMRWLQNRDNDYYYSLVNQIAGISKQGDVVLLEQGWIIDEYLLRFTELSQVEMKMKSELELQKIVDRALNAGHRVFFIPDLNAPPENLRTGQNSLLKIYSNRVFPLRLAGVDMAIIE